MGRLQTKLLEPVTAVDTAVFLDTRTVEPPFWGYVDQLLELAIITAASIATHATEHDLRIGLYVNQVSPIVDRAVRIPPSSDPGQLARILEALAQVHTEEVMPIARLVNQIGGTLPWTTTLLVVTAVPTPALLSSLARFRRAGRSTALVHISHEAPAFTGGIPTYQVNDRVAWERVHAISLAGVA